MSRRRTIPNEARPSEEYRLGKNKMRERMIIGQTTEVIVQVTRWGGVRLSIRDDEGLSMRISIDLSIPKEICEHFAYLFDRAHRLAMDSQEEGD